MYNNDEKVAWYHHPSIMCLISENWVDIQPWFGENGLMKGLNHCFKTRIGPARNNNKTILTHTW